MDLKLIDRILTLGNLIGQAKLAYIEANVDLEVVTWNAGAKNIFGYTEDDAMGRFLYELVPITRRELKYCKDTQFKVVEYINKAGEKIPCDLYYTSIMNTKGEKQGVAILCKDISSQLRDKQILNKQRKYMHDVFGFAPIGIYHVNNDDKIVQANPEFAWMLGYESADAISEQVTHFWDQMFYDPAKAAEFKFRIREADELIRYRCRLMRKDRSFVWALSYAKAIRDASGKRDGFYAFSIDISETVRAEQELKKAHDKLEMLAVMDGLTGIPNRRRFDQYLEAEWKRSCREKRNISVILSDIDFFKLYNDTYGHQAGDSCLQKVAHAIKESVHRPSDLAARYGGEEFVVVLPDTDRKGAVAVAETIRASVEALNIPHENSKVSHQVTLSLGVACFLPDGENTHEGLVSRADEALYKAKENGRNQVGF